MGITMHCHSELAAFIQWLRKCRRCEPTHRGTGCVRHHAEPACARDGRAGLRPRSHCPFAFIAVITTPVTIAVSVTAGSNTAKNRNQSVVIGDIGRA
jgi:hypothetical protein